MSKTGRLSSDLNLKLVSVMKNVLRELKVRSHDCGHYFKCRCPCHDSDNFGSMTVYKKGVWICWTSDCNDTYGKSLFDLCVAVLRQRGMNYGEIIKWCENITKGVEPSEPEIYEYKPPQKIDISREEIRKRLRIPPQYYLDKGFSPEILDKFDVGEATNGKMRKRIVFPVYDIDGDYVGCTGRRMEEKEYINKWLHSKNFPSSTTFYGINFARFTLEQTKTAILVEGCSDVVKLHQYGFTNVIGCFGAKLGTYQADFLKSLGIKTIVPCFDPDPDRYDKNKKEMVKGAGPLITNRIIKNYSNIFDIRPVMLSADPDETPYEELKEKL